MVEERSEITDVGANGVLREVSLQAQMLFILR